MCWAKCKQTWFQSAHSNKQQEGFNPREVTQEQWQVQTGCAKDKRCEVQLAKGLQEYQGSHRCSSAGWRTKAEACNAKDQNKQCHAHVILWKQQQTHVCNCQCRRSCFKSRTASQKRHQTKMAKVHCWRCQLQMSKTLEISNNWTALLPALNWEKLWKNSFSLSQTLVFNLRQLWNPKLVDLSLVTTRKST